MLRNLHPVCFKNFQLQSFTFTYYRAVNLTLTPDISKCFIPPDCSVSCSQPLRLSKFTVGARLVLNCLSVVNLVVYLVNIYADNFVVVDEIADILSKYSLTTLTPSFHKVPKKNARGTLCELCKSYNDSIFMNIFV